MPDVPLRWEISPRPGEKCATSNYKSCLGDEYGSHIYQLMLKKIELLLNNVPANNIIDHSPNLNKGKKHALTYNNEDPSTQKKPCCDMLEITDDVMMGEVGEVAEDS